MEKEITSIVFYKNTSKEGQQTPKACIFYSDQTYLITTKKEAKKQTKLLFHNKNIFANYFSFLNEKYIYYIEESIFEKYFETFLENNLEEIDQIEKIKIVDPFWRRAGIIAISIFMAMLIELYCGIEKKTTKVNLTEETTISYLGQDLVQPDLAYNNILSQVPNQSINTLLKKAKNFLYYYNIENAAESANEDIKSAMTFDEVLLLNVILNDCSLSEINTIYEGEDLNENTLKTIYLNGLNQLILSYIVDKNGSFSIEKMIDNLEERKEIQKYQNILIECKNEQGYEKEKKIKTLCTMIREEYLSSTNKEKKQYLSIIPLINATQILFADLSIENFLTLEEINIINYNFLYQKAKEKMCYITKSLDFSSGMPQIYEELKYIVESDLTKNNAYYVSEERRDITTTPQFIESKASNTAYLEIMISNYKMVLEESSINTTNVSITDIKSSEEIKINTKKFDK